MFSISHTANRIKQFLNQTFSRGPSMFRRMGIPMCEDPNPNARGLIIIQVDGLSYNRLQRALKKRKLPYVKKLLRRGVLRMHPYLSQIPTSTPAFQAGMFYGDNSNIPGFNFYDKLEKRLYRMGDSSCAYSVESGFEKPGLLTGGSVFSCVYSGNAAASLFIFSSLLAPQRWKFALRLYDVLMLGFIHIEAVVKMIVLSLVELGVSLWDAVRRIWQHGRVRSELEQVAVRVGLSVFSRELITLGAVIDVYRRSPAVYVNYLSYDEHAHMRGPNSAFARWTLKSIDHSIRKIHQASLFAERPYDLYILSDHGQCACRPFEDIAGQTLAEFLNSLLEGLSVESYSQINERTGQFRFAADATGRLVQSSPWILRKPLSAYSRRLRRHVDNEKALQEAMMDIRVVSTGPIAYVYWTRFPEKLTREEIQELHPGILDRLAEHECIGFISLKQANGDVFVRSRNGSAILSVRGVEVDGSLPFDSSINRQHVLDGVRRVTLMQRSGDICIWGGNSPKGDISFTHEYGSHSGYTDEEIQAFIMAPPGAAVDFARFRRHEEFYEYFSQRYERIPVPEEPGLGCVS